MTGMCRGASGHPLASRPCRRACVPSGWTGSARLPSLEARGYGRGLRPVPPALSVPCVSDVPGAKRSCVAPTSSLCSHHARPPPGPGTAGNSSSLRGSGSARAMLHAGECWPKTGAEVPMRLRQGSTQPAALGHLCPGEELGTPWPGCRTRHHLPRLCWAAGEATSSVGPLQTAPRRVQLCPAQVPGLCWAT